MKQKVVAYITRSRLGKTELLVFVHRDFPEAGLQVPAGTVEPGEMLEAALHREIAEESGLTALSLRRKLGESDEPQWDSHRHYYWLESPADTPDRWDWLTNDYHDDAHRQRGQALVFSYHWIALTPTVTLAGNQHKLLSAL